VGNCSVEAARGVCASEYYKLDFASNAQRVTAGDWRARHEPSPGSARPLEFSHGANDLRHQPAGRSTEVKIVPQADEGYTQWYFALSSTIQRYLLSHTIEGECVNLPQAGQLALLCGTSL
jgi:hypothetical protein